MKRTRDEPDDEGRGEGVRTGQRQVRWRRWVVALGVLAVVVVAAAGAIGLLSRREASLPQPAADPTPAGGGGLSEQVTLLLVRTEFEGGPARGLTLFAVGPGDTPPAVVFVPAGVLVEIPGVGLDRLGLAQQYGGRDLTRQAVENLLGIQVDFTAVVTDDGLGAALARVGPLEIEVADRLVRTESDGGTSERFPQGLQAIEGRRLSEYWSFRAVGESDVQSFPRQQQVLQQLFARLQDPSVLEALFAGGAPEFVTDVAPAGLRSMFATLAEDAGAIAYQVVPVQPFGEEGQDGTTAYRLDIEAAADVVNELLGPSVPPGGGPQALRIQVLNGVGRPGVGADVDQLLAGGPYRISRTENADRFDHPETLILVYDETEEALAHAQAVRDRLGVGTIRVSRQPQSVVDLTIVVGADFPVLSAPAPIGEPVPTPESTESPS